MEISSLVPIVLAAGKGTRMRSDRPKVLHDVFFEPMLHHVLKALQGAFSASPLVVIGHKAEEVSENLSGFDLVTVRQTEQLGTGHAVLSCREELAHHSGPVLILCGDSPLITSGTLRGFVESHLQSGAPLTLMTTRLNDPSGYGRIVCDPQGRILRIVEEKDADPDQKAIAEINAGIYCVDCCLLINALERIGYNNRQGEMYLTDIVGIATADHLVVNRYFCTDSEEVLGVNTRRELAHAHGILQKRHLHALMDSGVSIIQPELVTVAGSVVIGNETVISPHTWITGSTTIGCGVTIEPFVKIVDCSIGDRASIGAFCHLQGRVVPTGVTLAPHTSDCSAMMPL